MPTRTVLLTGFEPFDGEPVNPSDLIARALDGATIAGHRVVGLTLPCVFGESIEVLTAAMDTHDPVLVVGTGQAGGRDCVTPERVAINIDDARIPDERGNQRIDTPVVPGGPNAYWSTLPIKAVTRALREAGIPAAVSQTAGTFVCNHAFYGLMHRLATTGSPTRGGFVHVPFLPEQVVRAPGQPSLSLDVLTKAIRIVIDVALTTDLDEHLVMGASH